MMDLNIHHLEGNHRKDRVKIAAVISVLMLTTEDTDLDHLRLSGWRKIGNGVIA